MPGLKPTLRGAGWRARRAGMTPRTKVVLWRQTDFNSVNNEMFFEVWAGQECPGYLFVLGVSNARVTNDHFSVFSVSSVVKKTNSDQ